MKRRQALFTPVVLSLLVGILGGLVGGGTPALAASPTTSLVVPIGGTVDGLPESVYLSGLAHITSRLVTDPDFGSPPAVVLSIDLLNVSGQGLSTGVRYVSTGEEDVIRLLVPSDVVEITFPFFPNRPGGASLARPALASFTLSFNVSTGQLTGGTASLTTPEFPE